MWQFVLDSTKKATHTYINLGSRTFLWETSFLDPLDGVPFHWHSHRSHSSTSSRSNKMNFFVLLCLIVARQLKVGVFLHLPVSCELQCKREDDCREANGLLQPTLPLFYQAHCCGYIANLLRIDGSKAHGRSRVTSWQINLEGPPTHLNKASTSPSRL